MILKIYAPDFLDNKSLQQLLNNSHPNPGDVQFFQRDMQPSLCIRKCPPLKIHANKQKFKLRKRSDHYHFLVTFRRIFCMMSIHCSVSLQIENVLNLNVYRWLLKAKTSRTTIK